MITQETKHGTFSTFTVSKPRQNIESELNDLIKKLAVVGKKHIVMDTLSELLGSEEFTYKTRTLVGEIVMILEERPDLVKTIPEGCLQFFEGYMINGQPIYSINKWSNIT